MNPKPNWLKDEEIPADPISNWQTINNAMSVWQVVNDKNLFEQIVAALAANRELQDFEYVLLDPKIVDETGIKTIQRNGEIPDDNLQDLHRELVEISAQMLLKLTDATLQTIEQDDTRIDRIPRKTVAKYILDGIKKSRIDPSRVKPGLIEKAEKVTGHSIS